MSAAKINADLREDGFHYTVDDLQTKLAMALHDNPGDDWITIKIPGAYEMTWSRETVEAALVEADPFAGL